MKVPGPSKREGQIKCWHHLLENRQGWPNDKKQRWGSALTWGAERLAELETKEHQVPECGLVRGRGEGVDREFLGRTWTTLTIRTRVKEAF